MANSHRPPEATFGRGLDDIVIDQDKVQAVEKGGYREDHAFAQECI